MIKRDYLWKAAFRIFMQDFVKFFFPEKYDEIDWSKGVEFLDKELYKLQSQSPQNDRIADVLVRLYLKNGETVWVLLHIEVQGYLDKMFGKRMHQMRYRIEDLFGVNPVMLAILTDDDANFHPTEYKLDTWGATCRTCFLTYKVMDVPPSMFLILDSPVSIIMEVAYNATKAKQLGDDDLIKLHLPLVKKFLTMGYEKKHVKMLLSFVKGYLKFENSDNSIIFEEKIDNMVKYDTTESILAKVDSERLKYLKWLAKETARREFEKLKLAREEAERDQEAMKRDQEAMKLKQEQSILLMINQRIDRELIAKILNMTLEEIQTIEIKYKDKNPLNGYLNGHEKS